MKRLILLLILFVNLQIVITHEDMRLFSYSTASAQHMTKEAGDNCYDEYDHLWYHVDVAFDCNDYGTVSTPCRYCWMEFGTDEQAIGARNAHELACGLTIVECKYCHARVRRMDMEFHYGSSCPYWNFGNYSWKEMKNIIYASGGEPSFISGGGGHTGGSSSGGISILANQNTSSPFPVPRRTPVGRPAAAMAGYSYHDQLQDFYEDETGEWEVDEHEKTRFESHGVNFEIPLIGLKSELFVTMNTRREITGYVVSFAGTDSFKDNLAAFLIDAYNDAINLKDIPSPQYLALYNFVKKVEELVGDKPLTFVGHSLGGGLASLASILTGRPAIVFNPAAVAESYVTALELMGKSHGTSNIYGYIMEWDYVTIGQACFNVYAPGNFRIVKNKTGGDPHAIETMVENLK